MFTNKSSSNMAVTRYLQEAPHFAVQRRKLLLGHLREQLGSQQLLRHVRVLIKLFLSDSAQQSAQSFGRFNLRHVSLASVSGHVGRTDLSHDRRRWAGYSQCILGVVVYLKLKTKS